MESDFVYIRPFMAFLEKKGAAQKFRKMFLDYMSMGDHLFNTTPYNYITKAFKWSATAEGLEFWKNLSDEWTTDLDAILRKSNLSEAEAARYKEDRFASFGERDSQTKAIPISSVLGKPRHEHVPPNTMKASYRPILPTNPIILKELLERSKTTRRIISTSFS